MWSLLVATLAGVAFQLADGFSRLGDPARSADDVRHLLAATAIFLGTAGLDLATRTRSPDSRAVRTVRTVLWMQGLQLTEYLALVLTAFCLGRPTGISTLFGLVAPGQALWTYQTWWLLMVNLAVALLLLHTARLAWREQVGLLDVVVHGLKQVDLPNAAARVLRLVFGLAAVILAGDVVFVVLGANPGNDLVAAFNRLADDLVLFFRDLFLLSNQKASFAVNYGLAAGVYFLLGQAIARLPRRARGLRS